MFLAKMFNILEKNMNHITENKKTLPKKNAVFNKEFDERLSKNTKKSNDYIQRISNSIHNTKQ